MGLDWVRCIGDGMDAVRLWEWIAERWGGEWEKMPKALYRFAERYRWPCGVELWMKHATDGKCAVEIPGSVLDVMDGAERVALLRELRDMGFRPTRLDIAIDRRDPDARLDLVQRADCSARRGELCRFKKSRRIVGHGENRAERTGYTVYLGKKGSNGGGKSARIYDKGLEQNEKRRARFKPNEWHRWEVQFEHERAVQAADAMIDAGDGWRRVAAGLAVAVLDFREVSPTGRREIARRKPVRWFAAFCALLDALPIVTSKAARSARLDRFIAWARDAVGRTMMSLAAVESVGLDDVCREIFAGVDPGGSPEIIDGWREYVRAGRVLPLAT